MFENENKMGGLKLLYDSPDINAILNWGKTFYRDHTIKITNPKDGIRFFIRETRQSLYQYSSFIIQENKRYKIYG